MYQMIILSNLWSPEFVFSIEFSSQMLKVAEDVNKLLRMTVVQGVMKENNRIGRFIFLLSFFLIVLL